MDKLGQVDKRLDLEPAELDHNNADACMLLLCAARIRADL